MATYPTPTPPPTPTPTPGPTPGPTPTPTPGPTPTPTPAPIPMPTPAPSPTPTFPPRDAGAGRGFENPGHAHPPAAQPPSLAEQEQFFVGKPPREMDAPTRAAEFELNRLDSIRVANIEARGDGTVTQTRSGNYQGARQGDLSIATSPTVEAAIVPDGFGVNKDSNAMFASSYGTVSSSKNFNNNPELAAQTILAVKGVMNDGVFDPQEAAAMKRFMAEASGENKPDAAIVAAMKKFQALAPDAQHAILAKAGQIASTENLASYGNAALHIAEHFDPQNKDLYGAVEKAKAQANALNIPIGNIPNCGVPVNACLPPASVPDLTQGGKKER